MRCAICSLRIDSIDRAVGQGWTPYFYDGKTEHEVACPACTHALLQGGEEGEMEVKEKYRGKLTYFDDETGKEDTEKDLAIEIFFPRESEERRH